MATFLHCGVESCRCKQWCTAKSWGSTQCGNCLHQMTVDVTEIYLAANSVKKKQESPKPKVDKPKKDWFKTTGKKKKPEEVQKAEPSTPEPTKVKTPENKTKSWMSRDSDVWTCDLGRRCHCDGICIPLFSNPSRCQDCGHNIKKKVLPGKGKNTKKQTKTKSQPATDTASAAANSLNSILNDRGMDADGNYTKKKTAKKGKKKRAETKKPNLEEHKRLTDGVNNFFNNVGDSDLQSRLENMKKKNLAGHKSPKKKIKIVLKDQL